MKTKIFLSKEESVAQSKEVRNFSASAVMVNRIFLAWSKNGLTRKILNG
jgi:hypothetical protein